MGFSMHDVTNAITKGEHDAARFIGKTLIDAGHESSDLIRSTLNRLPGGLHVGSKVLGGGRPMPKHVTPGALPINTRNANGSYCSKLPGGKPFPLVGRIAITAGAQTQGTDLGDFHSTTANPTIITTSDLVPGNVSVKSCRLTIGVKMLTTAGADTIAVLDDLWVIERVNGTEIARWSPADLGCTIGHSGTLTSGNVASSIRIAGDWQEWDRTYDPNVPYAVAVQIGRTYTTIQDLDLTFVEGGQRP